MLVGARAIILIMNFFFVWNILERFAIVVKFDFSGFAIDLKIKTDPREIFGEGSVVYLR